MSDEQSRYGVLGAGLGVVFLCLAVLANGVTFKGIDYTFLRALEAMIGQKYHALLSGSTVVGSTEFTAFVVALIFAYAYFRRRRVLVGLSLFLALFVIEFWGKLLVFHPGPLVHSGPTSLVARQSPTFHLPGSMLRVMLACAVLLVIVVLVHILIERHRLVIGLSLLFAALVASAWDMLFLFGYSSASLFVRQHPAIFPLRWLYAQMEFSFPSGHMARTTFVCITLLSLLITGSAGRAKRLLGSLLAVLLLTAMSVSLVSLDFHWFSDVLGGMTLGASMAFLAAFVDGPNPHHPVHHGPGGVLQEK